ncbi:heavy metal translocatin [Hesseltinella vesiculosa]|uniref:P-type Cu(+) transporter n=1 Tax=Hesseltinella vesiculosa TaxID=101127 RepID=A0A1X2GHF2_9FUNG|nr:heavy metal translocatin [Hesseltinella vesiculosa]
MVTFLIKHFPLPQQEQQELVAAIQDLGYDVLEATFAMGANDVNQPVMAGQPSAADPDDSVASTYQLATLSLLGMTCSHCVNTITNGLRSLPGVVPESVQVSLDHHSAKLLCHKDANVTSQLLVDTIEELGYDVAQTPRIVPASSSSSTATLVRPDPDPSSPASSDGEQGNWAKVVMRVGGMTCESCVASVTDALSSLPNVQPGSVQVRLETEMAMVVCKQPDLMAIRELIESRGYEVDNMQLLHNLTLPAPLLNTDSPISLRKPSLSPSLHSLGAVSVVADGPSKKKKVTMTITGMTCASCVRTLEKGLAKLPSVDASSIKVNLLTGSASMQAYGDALTSDDVAHAVDNLGYTTSNITFVDDGPRNVQLQQPAFETKMIISGMYCPSCVAKVESVLSGLPGVIVKSIHIDLDSGITSFSMNKDTLTRQRLSKEIQQLGFAADSIDIRKTATDDTSSDKNENMPALVTSRLTVTGMTCSSCVANIERVMLKQPGVQQCQVNLLAKMAVLVHDPQIIGVRDLANMIEQIGYKAEVAQDATADALADQRQAMRQALDQEISVLKRRFLWSLLFAVPTVLIAMIFLMALPASNPVYQAFMHNISPGLTVGDLVLFLLATPVQFWLGAVFYKKAWGSLYRSHTANMETLVALGTTVAYGASLGTVIANMVRASATASSMIMTSMPTDESNGMNIHMNNFETSVLLITFIHLGKWMEAVAKGKTAETITKLMDLQPEQAILVNVKKQGDEEVLIEQAIEASSIQVGDLLKVNAGGRIPCDGKLWRGTTTTDESMITGESVPVTKQVGDELISATINVTSPIYMRALRVGSDTTLARIIQLVQDAQASPKAPIEHLADKISSVFVPVVIVLALATFIIWQVLSVKNMYPSSWVPEGENGTVFSVMLAVSILVIACPCGLGLASPTAIMVGTGVAARYGILVKGGGFALEMANRMTTVAFDKTGTLTLGKPEVTDHWLNDHGQASDDTAFWKILGRLASISNHPLSKAMEKHAQAKLMAEGDVDTSSVETRHDDEKDKDNQRDWYQGITVVHGKEVAGRGVQATVTLTADLAGQLTGKLRGNRALNVFLGNQAWMNENHARYDTAKQAAEQHEQQLAWQDQGKSLVMVAASPVAGPVDPDTSASHEDGCRNVCACLVCHCSTSSLCCSASKTMMLAQVALADVPRPEAIQVIDGLRRLGIDVWMITGDNERTAGVVATQLGIDRERVLAGVKPEQKADKISNLQRRGRPTQPKSRSWSHPFGSSTTKYERSVVAMIGDGINDSPALAQADLGISVGSATDIAMEAASIVLIRNNLMDLLTMYAIAKTVVRRIRLNFVWAFLYNACAIPIASGILYPAVGTTMPPYIAGVAMVLSSITVVCSSLLLRLYRPPTFNNTQ